MQIQIKHHTILFWIGLLGIIFYVVAPIVFPHDNLRQPELLPVYTLMLGIGQLMKGTANAILNTEEQKKLEDGGSTDD